MDWLNYHHLYYFSVIAREGGVAPAARKLRLTHSTLSTQLGALEAHFGVQLFERRGRRLVLTSFGADALRYAEDIFRLGRELNDVARGRSSPSRDILRVGVVAGLPKTLVHRLLGPVLEQDASTLVVQQDSGLNLLEALVAGRIHAVLLDEVPAPATGTRIYSHSLGETDILLYARARLAQAVRRDFPGSLSNVPFLLPPTGAPLRRRLDAWFVEHDLRIVVKAEVEDAGLLRVLGSAGRGVFPVRGAVRAEVEDLIHNVEPQPLAMAEILWPMGALQPELKLEARSQELARAAQRLPMESRTIVLRELRAADAILAQAQAINAELVVIGARRGHWLDGWPNGVTAQVVNRARCSVLVLPLDAQSVAPVWSTRSVSSKAPVAVTAE